uniref:Cleavage inducing molecular chaperone Jiv domain-containing protein n=1 Tax=Nothoprocta perdicaria TaxID=30464 RepID=A0A8C6YNI4_NOTPE
GCSSGVCGRFAVPREPLRARYCAACGRLHAAGEGDLWAESSLLGLRVTYLAVTGGRVFDVTEWAGCQRVPIAPDTHRVLYHISAGPRGAAGRHRTFPLEHGTFRAFPVERGAFPLERGTLPFAAHPPLRPAGLRPRAAPTCTPSSAACCRAAPGRRARGPSRSHSRSRSRPPRRPRAPRSTGGAGRCGGRCRAERPRAPRALPRNKAIFLVF